MQESADSMMAGLQAGANFIFQAAGWLEGGLTMGYEKFMLDVDHCGQLQRYLGGLSIDANQLGAHAFTEAGIGNNFLGTGHTMSNFRDANHITDLADNTAFEHWNEAGSKDSEQRANERFKAELARYEAPPIDPGVDEALLDFMAQKKASMADAWY